MPGQMATRRSSKSMVRHPRPKILSPNRTMYVSSRKIRYRSEAHSTTRFPPIPSLCLNSGSRRLTEVVCRRSSQTLADLWRRIPEKRSQGQIAACDRIDSLPQSKRQFCNGMRREQEPHFVILSCHLQLLDSHSLRILKGIPRKQVVACYKRQINGTVDRASSEVRRARNIPLRVAVHHKHSHGFPVWMKPRRHIQQVCPLRSQIAAHRCDIESRALHGRLQRLATLAWGEELQRKCRGRGHDSITSDSDQPYQVGVNNRPRGQREVLRTALHKVVHSSFSYGFAHRQE